MKLTKRPRMPWSWFFAISLTIVALLTVVIMWFRDNYAIAGTDQVDKCIPGYSVFLIDKKDKRPRRGEIFAFQAKGINAHFDDAPQMVQPLREYFRDGRVLVKVMVGMPDDRIVVDEVGVEINGEKVGETLALINTLGRSAAHYTRQLSLASRNYWMMGQTPDSFDARYWGAIHEEQLVGRAIPLF